MSHWREAEIDGHDPALERLKQAYLHPENPRPVAVKSEASPGWRDYRRVAHLLLNEGIDFGRPLKELPPNALFVDISHNGLATDFLTSWLVKRPDIRAVFMVHDAIPLQLPEFIAPRNVDIHKKIMATTAARANHVIVPTASTAVSVEHELRRLGAVQTPVHPVNLPIDDIFDRGHKPMDVFATHPYFLVCGAIETRKNVGFLITVWRHLVTKMGSAAPNLILAGRAGYGGANAIDQIERSTLLHRHIFIATGLSTPSIARLMAGAQAVLMPSFAEGFGLPPLESMAIGTPAVLSDIPAHRDAAGEFGLFLEPTDGPGWLDVIEKLTMDPEFRAKQRSDIEHYVPKRWPRYMAEITDIFQGIEVHAPDIEGVER